MTLHVETLRPLRLAVVSLVAAVLLVVGETSGASANEQVSSDEDVYAFGGAAHYGSTGDINMANPAMAMAVHPSGKGYWQVASDGGIFSFGDARFHGSAGDIKLNEPIMTMTSTGSGEGYWLGAFDGGVFAYGDAQFHGSAGDLDLNEPITGMTVTPSGDGYWLVAEDGGIFSYGDAQFHGSAGGLDLNRPIVGMAATPSGDGYWLVAEDGGIFSYGDAQFHGSTGGIDLERPVTGMAVTPDGGGYWLAARDGGVFTFGNATFYGSAADDAVDKPVVDIAARPQGDGYWLLARNVEVCQNSEWRAEYPDSWHTNRGEVVEQCSYFDPEEIEVRRGTEASGIAYRLDIEPVSYDRATSPDSRCATLLSQDDTMVDGRRAVIQEQRATGRCLYPEGTRTYRYIADVDNGETLHAVAVEEPGDPPYDVAKRELDNTMLSLELDPW